jgi:hypothetical protein
LENLRYKGVRLFQLTIPWFGYPSEQEWQGNDWQGNKFHK